MTCKDCLIYEKCYKDAYEQAFREGRADKVLIFIANRMPCKYFKNKADVVEVRHGEWKPCFEDWRKQIEGDECSVCGFQHYGTTIRDYHYCPNCGAKMDGKGE